MLVFYRIEGTQNSFFGEATLFTSGSFCVNLDLNLKRSFIFLDWLSKKSGWTSEFWEASRVFTRQKFGAQHFGFSISNTGATSGIGCKEGETPFLV